MLELAQEQLANLRQREVSARHKYEMLRQSLENEVKVGNEDLDEAKKEIAESTEAKATAEGELGVTAK